MFVRLLLALIPRTPTKTAKGFSPPTRALQIIGKKTHPDIFFKFGYINNEESKKVRTCKKPCHRMEHRPSQNSTPGIFGGFQKRGHPKKLGRIDQNHPKPAGLSHQKPHPKSQRIQRTSEGTKRHSLEVTCKGPALFGGRRLSKGFLFFST